MSGSTFDAWRPEGGGVDVVGFIDGAARVVAGFSVAVALLLGALMALEGCAGEGAPEGAAARTMAALEGNIRTGVYPDSE